MLLIILAMGGAIAGTWAYFTATRTAETNTFTAGTLDLNVTGDSIANKPFVITNMGANANISGSQD
ncbi:MAG: TasA family protein [Candidatus Roizmanbacteria bacterium]|nr:TasA family protein [Candidatus Roizmanbacteria bacterium]